jgi:hypothetical protein
MNSKPELSTPRTRDRAIVSAPIVPAHTQYLSQPQPLPQVPPEIVELLLAQQGHPVQREYNHVQHYAGRDAYGNPVQGYQQVTAIAVPIAAAPIQPVQPCPYPPSAPAERSVSSSPSSITSCHWIAMALFALAALCFAFGSLTTENTQLRQQSAEYNGFREGVQLRQ